MVGNPDFEVKRNGDKFTVTVGGIDVYDPNTNEVSASDQDDIAAWMVDHDYDGRTFCACQMFFPAETGKGLEKLRRSLKESIRSETWERVSKFESAPFSSGEHKRVAVKIIDRRGNEVVGVRSLKR